jgi:hypothetical protein
MELGEGADVPPSFLQPNGRRQALFGYDRDPLGMAAVISASSMDQKSRLVLPTTADIEIST